MLLESTQVHPELRGAAGGRWVGGISGYPTKNGFRDATGVFFPFFLPPLLFPPMGTLCFGLQVQVEYTEREQLDAGWPVENRGKIIFFLVWAAENQSGTETLCSSGKSTTSESRLQARGLCFCVLYKVAHGDSRLCSGSSHFPDLVPKGR